MHYVTSHPQYVIKPTKINGNWNTYSNGCIKEINEIIDFVMSNKLWYNGPNELFKRKQTLLYRFI